MSAVKFILQVACPDQSGLIAACAREIAQTGANILDLAQHTAKDIGTFFLRALAECDAEAVPRIEKRFAEMAKEKSMEWSLCDAGHRARVALFGSTTDHCIYELLLARKDGALPCEFACMISNHDTLKPIAEAFGIPFYCVPSDCGKKAQEERFGDILEKERVEVIALARYMQILSPEFTERWAHRIINIHHGFLPAFKGARPYHQAWAKGVKIIGATAHFATADLDQGPIIWQSVLQVPDTSSIEQFIQIGKEAEKRTLLRALQLYLDRRVFMREGRTFIL